MYVGTRGEGSFGRSGAWVPPRSPASSVACAGRMLAYESLGGVLLRPADPGPAGSPGVATVRVGPIGDVSATLISRIDRRGRQTRYCLYVGPLFGHTEVLAGHVGLSPRELVIRLEDLWPETEYTYQLVAVKRCGTAESTEGTFMTSKRSGDR